MLDSFWFAKRQGSEGTSVTQLAGGANLGELSDLMYFIKKLYRALKVPSTRLDPNDQASADGSTILREELKFARFVMRLAAAFTGRFCAALFAVCVWVVLGLISPCWDRSRCCANGVCQ